MTHAIATAHSAAPPGPPPRARVIRRVLVAIAALYAAWGALLFLVQDRLLFVNWLMSHPGAEVPAGAESIWIRAGSGERVEAWFFPPRRRAGAPANPAPAVILFHGNAETIDRVAPIAEMYADLGWAVLLPEYRGYGRSGGSPSQAGIGADMRRFYDILAARPDVDPQRIVFHGRSVGGGVACDLARPRAAAGLILESTFTSVASFCWRYGVPPWLCRNPFRNDRVVREFDGPILIMHGTHDEIVPVEHGRALRDLARDATYVEMPAGHNDFPPDVAAYRRAIADFLTRLERP